MSDEPSQHGGVSVVLNQSRKLGGFGDVPNAWLRRPLRLFVIGHRRGFARRVAGAVVGSSGQGCRGYRPRISDFTAA